MVRAALGLRAGGGLMVSVEPLIGTVGASSRSAMEELFAAVDLVTPDWPSAVAFAGTDDPRRVVGYWSRLGPRVVAVRRAEHGSYVWSRDQDHAWHIPAVPVDVVDPTGAGNAYDGGLCAGWLATGRGSEAGAYAAVSASFLLEQPECQRSRRHCAPRPPGGWRLSCRGSPRCRGSAETTGLLDRWCCGQRLVLLVVPWSVVS